MPDSYTVIRRKTESRSQITIFHKETSKLVGQLEHSPIYFFVQARQRRLTGHGL
jgi:hypothetical protein